MNGLRLRLFRLRALVSLLGAVAVLSSGCVWGVVADAKTGAPIVGANVKYTDVNGKVVETKTDLSGIYGFGPGYGPAAGPAILEVHAQGYETKTQPCTIEYNDNPGASLSNLASFWEVQSVALSPGPVADVAVTDLFPDNLPVGKVWARLTNYGPDAVPAGTKVWCYMHIGQVGTGLGTSTSQSYFVEKYGLEAGQTRSLEAEGLEIDTNNSQYYEIKCTAVPVETVTDPNPNNLYYTEVIP